MVVMCWGGGEKSKWSEAAGLADKEGKIAGTRLSGSRGGGEGGVARP